MSQWGCGPVWVEVTRRTGFSAARRLTRSDWTEKQNRSFYGTAVRWHGHDFTLDVTVGGDVAPETGMVVDLKQLKSLIGRHVIEVLDHQDLGGVEWLAGLVPSNENLVLAIWKQLATRIAGEHRLVELKLWQGTQRAVSCRGESWKN